MLAQMNQAWHLIEMQGEGLTRIWTQLEDVMDHVVIQTQTQESHFLCEYSMKMTR